MDPGSVMGDLLASLIAFVAGFSFRSGWRYWYELRPGRRALGIAVEEPVSIIVGDARSHGSRSRRSHARPALYEADVIAANAIFVRLRNLFPRGVIRFMTPAALDESGPFTGNLVIVGGPLRNPIYRVIAARMPIPFEFGERDGLATLTRVADGRTFSMTVDEHGRTTSDFGIVILAPSPFSSTSRVVIAAGCGTLGTMAAATMLTLPYAHTLPRDRQGDSVVSYVLVETEVVEGFTTPPRVIAAATVGSSSTRRDS